jgi:hypothetical protein
MRPALLYLEAQGSTPNYLLVSNKRVDEVGVNISFNEVKSFFRDKKNALQVPIVSVQGIYRICHLLEQKTAGMRLHPGSPLIVILRR